MQALQHIREFDFEGNKLTTLTYKGRPCWIAREVGELLGYSKNGGRLVNKITQDWGDEFIEGIDYIEVQGQELSFINDVLEQGPDSVPCSSWHLILLFETGLNLVCLKTNKPLGKRLRRFFAEEVFPQITRDSSYIPGRRVEGDRVLSCEQSHRLRRLALREARETRLKVREERLKRRTDRLHRQNQYQAIHSLIQTLENIGTCPDDLILKYGVIAAENAMEKRFPEFEYLTKDYWDFPT